MKTDTKRTLQHHVLVVCALALSACGGVGQDAFTPSTTSDSSSSELDLALGEEYGALTDDDEAPDFGDEEIADDADLNDDGADVDDAETDAEIDAIDQQYPDLRVRRVPMLLVCGKLAGAPPADDALPLEWSGKISVENAGLRVRRTVAFDAQDHIVRPRSDVRSLEVVSFTKPHVDGLVVEVLLHPALGSSLDTPPVLHVESPAYTGSLTIVPGMERRNVVLVDDAGNGVAYLLLPRRPDRPDCRQGFLAGRWQKLEDTDDGRELGRLKGKILDEGGRVIGKLRGVWGERQTNGSQVFFAKIIDGQGRFRAALAGRYEDGRFFGRVLGKDRVRRGFAAGAYRVGDDGEHGSFRGRIGELCGELPDEGAVEAHDEESDGAVEQ